MKSSIWSYATTKKVNPQVSSEASEAQKVFILLKILKERSYKTYLSRLYASNRLSSRRRAWNTSLVSMSAAATIASISLLSNVDLYGPAGSTLLVCFSVMTLVVSLIISSADYSGRSRDMFHNYRRAQRLSAEVERAAKMSQDYNLLDVNRLNERYDALLDESENHIDADYYRAFPDIDRPSLKIREKAIRKEKTLYLLPYLSLLAPLALLIPLANWVI